uniref:Uncharacterized protein n=1 Tax=Lepeophtheirus salmonis TaxID=72036 RepID=A0A0K2VH44_LEPSM
MKFQLQIVFVQNRGAESESGVGKFVPTPAIKIVVIYLLIKMSHNFLPAAINSIRTLQSNWMSKVFNTVLVFLARNLQD